VSGRAVAARFRTAAWLGWQIEANWADPFTFIVYSVLRPLATALILAIMYRAVAGVATAGQAFLGFYVANAFHEYAKAIEFEKQSIALLEPLDASPDLANSLQHLAIKRLHLCWAGIAGARQRQIQSQCSLRVKTQLHFAQPDKAFQHQSGPDQ
jgi:hypothetical protein